MIGGLSSTDTYNYDDANRLTDVNGVLYTWDNNGNLLNDGVDTYTYDVANRMISSNGQGINAMYAYSGLGDRLQQTVNGNTTTYTLDLNTGLTQVLSDGTNQYLYGVGRIAQVNTGTEYILSDALGSVRQLTNAQGNVILAKSYVPYGEVAASVGSGTSAFAFTGEQMDASGLTYLRARYYASSMGRFTSRDTWDGDYNRPLSLNRWMYVEGNPINRTDPSGMCYTDPNIFSSGYWSRFFEPPMFKPCTSSPGQPNIPPTTTPLPPPTITPTCTPTNIPTLPPAPTDTPTPIDILMMPFPGDPAYDEAGAWGKTLQKYKDLRDWALSNAPDDLIYSGDPDGYGYRFKDEVLMSIIISVEFVTLRTYTYIFEESLGALSNQYTSPTFCSGNCDSVKKQLIWLSTKQGIRRQPVDWIGRWYPQMIDYGTAVKNGGYLGRQGWEWGNYKIDSPFDKNKDKYPSVAYKDIWDPPYAGFVVFTAEQDSNCGACLGW